ncbi:fumarate hydratase [Pyrococcus yayanosii CH1]|uniref:Fumarate hydratase n=1 Tax=Pyrococcus yayanosii (strain CH1 / JCM 16557) TaxID=529709 RepID=F8AIJ3_PYRYC|nr:fumarate hydratase [Pyrococcus yayanosii CH1]
MRLKTPLSARDVLRLKVGDKVLLSGIVYTARDLAHKRIIKEGPPFNPEGAVIYHCGPLIKDDRVISAGPTTSARMNIYLEEVLRMGIRGIIGKGGMMPEPFRGRAVYFAFPGGAGSLAAEHVRRIKGVFWPELGMPEAVWALEVEDLPLLVAIDAHGRTLYRKFTQELTSRPSQL